MNRVSILIALSVALALPATAQEVVAPPTPNADQLADAMRTLARAPRDVRALLTAGEMSARLNDPSAAAGFFARAQALEPTNPRLKAGQAMVMVRMERPGEALRLFDQATRAGLSIEHYVSDRGLAYDLIGAQEHAQRDHRAAMRDTPDDETVRRFALSLGISGKVDEAMTVLDPLLRRTDRASWRARAFILAMNGDAAGADKIAAGMMGGFGTALSPFFRRLPTLSASDKAFAVHFGEIQRTPARIADAGVAPPLPQLQAEQGVAVASVEPARAVAAAAQPAPVNRRERRRADERAAQEATQRAAGEAQARKLAETKAAEQRESQRLAEIKAQQAREALAARQREAERLAASRQAALDAEAMRAAARESEEQRIAQIAAQQRAAEAQAMRDREARQAAELAAGPAAPARATEISRPTAMPFAVAQPSAALPTAAPLPGEQTAVPDSADEPTAVQRVRSAVAEPVAPPVSAVGAIDSPAAPAATASAQPVGSTAPRIGREDTAPRIGREDNVIARIIAGITIPASELGIEPMPGRAEPTAPDPVVEASATLATPARAPVVAAKSEPAPPTPAPTPRASPAAKAKAVAPAKAKPDPAKAEPVRHWVQVAGGANVNALPREWARLIDKAPAEFRGQQAWTTPLRFTNRLLVGPFKTSAEAQRFVNMIGAKGLSAFAWTSEAGQKIAKLPAK